MDFISFAADNRRISGSVHDCNVSLVDTMITTVIKWILYYSKYCVYLVIIWLRLNLFCMFSTYCTIDQFKCSMKCSHTHIYSRNNSFFSELPIWSIYFLLNGWVHCVISIVLYCSSDEQIPNKFSNFNSYTKQKMPINAYISKSCESETLNVFSRFVATRNNLCVIYTFVKLSIRRSLWCMSRVCAASLYKKKIHVSLLNTIQS